jgi:hypothetical protein
VTARLRAVSLGLAAGPSLASASGRKTSDFEFERGFVALIRRGNCTFQVKVVENAAAAGAAGVVIMNEGTDGRTDVFSGQLSQPAPIPVVGVSYELGCSLDIAARGGANVRLEVTQKNASDDDPATEAIYEVGTLASVLQLLKLPDGTVKVLVEGAQRAKVLKYTPSTRQASHLPH